jgi:hypothetical protein
MSPPITKAMSDTSSEKKDNVLDIEREAQSGSDSDSMELSISAQIAKEEGNEIKFRTCSWQKTAALLFSEYICLAILSFPWSYSILGLVPGIILTLAVAASVLYTSLVLWRFCLKHPQVRDVCDIGQILFGGSKIAYNVTAVFFMLNNTFIQGMFPSSPTKRSKAALLPSSIEPNPF